MVCRICKRQAAIKQLMTIKSLMRLSGIAGKVIWCSAWYALYSSFLPRRSLSLINHVKPVGVLYRPSEKKLKNAAQRDFLGKPVRIAAA